MESIKNALGLGSDTQEPVSGQTGNTSAGEPYDAGNISSTNTQRVGGSSLGSSHVGAASSSEGGLGGTGDATRTAPGGQGSASHVGAASSSSGTGLAQPSERDAARTAGSDRLTSGSSSTGTSHMGTGSTNTASSNIGPITDGRTSSGSTGPGSSASHSTGSGGIGPIVDGRNTSGSTGSSTLGHSSTSNSSAIPGTTGAAVGVSSGFLPVRSNDGILADNKGMSRSSQPSTDIQTAQRDGSLLQSGSSVPSTTHHHSSETRGEMTGLQSGQSFNDSSRSTTDQHTGSQSRGAVDSAAIGADSTVGSAKATQEATGGQTGHAASQSANPSLAKDEDAQGRGPRAGSNTGGKDDLENSKKHASPAVAKILEEADQKVKDGGIKKLGPNESSDPEASKKLEQEVAHEEHHEKTGLAAKVKGALHMGGSKHE